MSARTIIDIGDGPFVLDVEFGRREGVCVYLNDVTIIVDKDCVLDLLKRVEDLRHKLGDYVTEVQRQTVMGSDLGWKDGQS